MYQVTELKLSSLLPYLNKNGFGTCAISKLYHNRDAQPDSLICQHRLPFHFSIFQTHSVIRRLPFCSPIFILPIPCLVSWHFSSLKYWFEAFMVCNFCLLEIFSGLGIFLFGKLSGLFLTVFKIWAENWGSEEADLFLREGVPLDHN